MEEGSVFRIAILNADRYQIHMIMQELEILKIYFMKGKNKIPECL
jgi:hypothetical protein